MITVVGAVALGIWIYLLAGRGMFWRMRDESAGSIGAAVVTAIVPARNEADVVGQAVTSLTGVRVVVVDDGSEDGTADVARAAGATVVTARPLPAGWSGKLWAVSEGLRAAQADDPEYWLLTDADIVHPPDNVAGLVARARTSGYDLVSYMARLHCQSPAEQALIPAFVFFFFMLYPPAWIRSARHRTAGAAGGCILIRREALDRIGGIERIRGELIDDCALAREMKRSGGKIWLGLSARTRSIRRCQTFGEIGRMISRTAFTQLGHSWWMLAGTVAGLAITYLSPPALTLWGPAGAAKGMGALAWLLMSAAYFPAVRFYGRPWFWAMMLPAIAVFYMGATVYSALSWTRGRGGLWKGRTQAVQ